MWTPALPLFINQSIICVDFIPVIKLNQSILFSCFYERTAKFSVWIRWMVTGSCEREHLTFAKTEMEKDVWQRLGKQTVSFQTAAAFDFQVIGREQSIRSLSQITFLIQNAISGSDSIIWGICKGVKISSMLTLTPTHILLHELLQNSEEQNNSTEKRGEKDAGRKEEVAGEWGIFSFS